MTNRYQSTKKYGNVFLGIGSALLCACLLAACGSRQDSELSISIIDRPSAIFNSGGASFSPASGLVRQSVAQGLISYDATGQILPGLAQRWIVTDDGQSFIFRIDKLTWENGRNVTAEQVAAALTRRLKMARQGPLKADLTEIRDIRAMTDQVLEVRLTAPKPDLLKLLALPEFGIDRNGLGTGPLKGERKNRRMVLVHSQAGSESGEDAPSDDEPPALTVRSESAAKAIARYRMDYADIVLGGRFQHLPLLDAADINRNDIKIDPVVGLFGLMFVENTGFLSENTNREAVSMAIDRTRINRSLNLDGAARTNKIIPDYIENFTSNVGEPWADLDIATRQSLARRRVEGWVATNGEVAPLRIALPSGPGSDLLFASIGSELERIGLKARKVDMSASADLRLVDEVAAYNKPVWYLNQLSCIRRTVCDSDGSALVVQAKQTANLAERARILAQAETDMTDFHSFIVLGEPIRWSLVRGEPQGFSLNAWGYHPLWEMLSVTK